jgi:hypothetical protein
MPVNNPASGLLITDGKFFFALFILYKHKKQIKKSLVRIRMVNNYIVQSKPEQVKG